MIEWTTPAETTAGSMHAMRSLAAEAHQAICDALLEQIIAGLEARGMTIDAKNIAVSSRSGLITVSVTGENAEEVVEKIPEIIDSHVESVDLEQEGVDWAELRKL